MGCRRTSWQNPFRGTKVAHCRFRENDIADARANVSKRVRSIGCASDGFDAFPGCRLARSMDEITRVWPCERRLGDGSRRHVAVRSFEQRLEIGLRRPCTRARVNANLECYSHSPIEGIVLQASSHARCGVLRNGYFARLVNRSVCWPQAADGWIAAYLHPKNTSLGMSLIPVLRRAAAARNPPDDSLEFHRLRISVNGLVTFSLAGAKC
ncbi:hypothetical protein T440DRAFT_209836 [Plenodomus tracheiphilus IPT5]|uniref:Uncharacterized protein n=1 Tax=Plenodomus tracheiphilus IPT5 TaxID=1408161 RepID=A0A6A7BIQ6_9PLEO|nr:hypothetical protein T440DRAFT_209836 [Plenodomus tracheiphilus IPT5]